MANLFAEMEMVKRVLAESLSIAEIATMLHYFDIDLLVTLRFRSEIFGFGVAVVVRFVSHVRTFFFKKLFARRVNVSVVSTLWRDVIPHTFSRSVGTNFRGEMFRPMLPRKKRRERMFA